MLKHIPITLLSSFVLSQELHRAEFCHGGDACRCGVDPAQVPTDPGDDVCASRLHPHHEGGGGDPPETGASGAPGAPGPSVPTSTSTAIALTTMALQTCAVLPSWRFSCESVVWLALCWNEILSRGRAAIAELLLGLVLLNFILIPSLYAHYKSVFSMSFVNEYILPIHVYCKLLCKVLFIVICSMHCVLFENVSSISQLNFSSEIIWDFFNLGHVWCHVYYFKFLCMEAYM